MLRLRRLEPMPRVGITFLPVVGAAVAIVQAVLGEMGRGFVTAPAIRLHEHKSNTRGHRMSRWIGFDDVIESTAERQTRQDDAKRSIYRFDPSYRCPKCDDTFDTQAARDDHMLKTYNANNLPRWMTK